MLDKRLLKLITQTPTTKQGRLVSAIGCGLLTATVFPALYLDYGIAIYLAILLVLTALVFAAVRWVDQRAQSH